MLNDGFLFRANRLCIPVGSIHLLLIQEAHGGGLVGQFGAKKTEDVFVLHFFWPKNEERRRAICGSLHYMSKS